MAHDLQRDAVHAAASRAPLIATVGLFLAGFLIGPYALWRARTAQGHVQARPWMRGKWQVYAAFFLGSVAAVQGILVLAGRLLGGE
jgi:hypothetical protein